MSRISLPGTPAASEGYGGYCVPKDGLFLAFVLGLSNETKLRQMGIPASMHAVVLALAKDAILHHGDFESDFDWQTWVARKLLSIESLRAHVSQYVGIREMKGADVLVFNIAKIAESIQVLGQPLGRKLACLIGLVEALVGLVEPSTGVRLPHRAVPAGLHGPT